MTKDESPAAAVEQRLRDRLRHATGLPTSDLDSIGVLIAAGEWTVALEVLCTQIDEYEVDPTRGRNR